MYLSLSSVVHFSATNRRNKKLNRRLKRQEERGKVPQSGPVGANVPLADIVFPKDRVDWDPAIVLKIDKLPPSPEKAKILVQYFDGIISHVWQKVMGQPAEAQPKLRIISSDKAGNFCANPTQEHEGNSLGLNLSPLRPGMIAHELRHAKNNFIRTRLMIQRPEKFVNAILYSMDNDSIESLVRKQASAKTLDPQFKEAVDNYLKRIFYLYVKNTWQPWQDFIRRSDIHKPIDEEFKRNLMEITTTPDRIQVQLIKARVDFFANIINYMGYPGYAVPKDKDVSLLKQKEIYNKLMLSPMSPEEEKTAIRLTERAASQFLANQDFQGLHYALGKEELHARHQEYTAVRRSLLVRSPKLKELIKQRWQNPGNPRVQAKATDLWPEAELAELVALPEGKTLFFNDRNRRILLGDHRIRKVIEQLSDPNKKEQVPELQGQIRRLVSEQIKTLEQDNRKNIVCEDLLKKRKEVYLKLLGLVSENTPTS